MIMLLCLIFVGQSMASSMMFYSMVDMENMDTLDHNMAMMDHGSDHNGANTVSTSSDDDSSSDDCCAKECQCFASGCSTISAFAKNNTNDLILDLSTKIHYDNSSIPNLTTTSLFRPPIFS